MSWLDSTKIPKLKRQKKREEGHTPSGLWKKCDQCGEILQSSKLEENAHVCPYCNHHFRLSAQKRMELLVDAGSFCPLGEAMATQNPLNFNDARSYDQRLKDAWKKTGHPDSCMCGQARIGGHSVALAVMNFAFMGGSMGVVTGEKIAMVMDRAREQKIPAVVVSCSGGARMQEGILSLMQMAKTAGARGRLKKAGLPYISVITDPTTGGVAASFAMLGDVNLAEPQALIGFAGPRVIEQSIRQSLPEGFQRSEFLLEHGFIDQIVHRHHLKEELTFFIKMFSSPTTKKS